MPKTSINLDDFATVVEASNEQMPRGIAIAITGLFKRGKTYGLSRFNPSGDVRKTLFIDTERCVLKYEEYNGMTVLPCISFAPPRDGDGKIIPPEDRNYIINGKNFKAWSFQEICAIVHSLKASGMLHQQFELVAIDTVDNLQNWAEAYHLEKYNQKQRSLKEKGEVVDSIGEIPYGSGWSDARDELVRPLLRMKEEVNQVGVDFGISIHAKTTSQVKNIYQRDPALRAGVTNALFGEMDLIGYVNVEDTDLPDGAEFGAVFQGKLHTISFVVSEEIMTGGTRLNRLVNKTLPFSYQALVNEYKKKEEKCQ